MEYFLFKFKNRNFFRLWLAQLISQFGDRVHQFALVGLIAERSPGSTVALAKLMAFSILPALILQPLAGVFVDRWDRRTTLFVCDVFRGILVLLIPFAFIYYHSMVPIYIIVFLVFCFPRFYVPAKMSIIPDLVNKENILEANSLITTTGMIAAGLGFTFGALIVEQYGARNGFIVDAFTFFLSAVFVFNMSIPWRLTISRERILRVSREIASVERTVWSEIKSGFKYIRQHKDILFVIQTLFTLLAAAGAVYIVLIVFIQQAFQSVTKDLGIIVTSLVIGLFCGVVVYGRVGKRFTWKTTILGCLIAGGVMLLAFAFTVSHYQNILMAIALAFLWGLVIGPIFVCANTIVHEVSNEEMRGKVFSALEMVIHFAFLLTMLLSSWASEHVGEGTILMTVGIGCVVVGVGGFLSPGGLRKG